LTSHSLKKEAVEFKVIAVIFDSLFLLTSYHTQQPADWMTLHNISAAGTQRLTSRFSARMNMQIWDEMVYWVYGWFSQWEEICVEVCLVLS
jgi:hypothetical protein